MPKSNGRLTLRESVRSMTHREVLSYTPHYLDAEFVLEHKLSGYCSDCPLLAREEDLGGVADCPAGLDVTSWACLHVVEAITLLRDMIEADLLLREKDGDVI